MKKNIFWTVVLTIILGATFTSISGCSKSSLSQNEINAEEQARLKSGEEQQRRLREQRLREDQTNKLTDLNYQAKENFQNQDIYFDYDRYDLRPDAKLILNDKSSFLHSHSDINIIIEGHCDERGSSAYNLALGEKRAKTTAAYLVAMGIASSRLETVSYGKERPLINAHTEEAYATNRRSHLVIK